MAHYLLTYDLNNAKDYSRLINRLNELGGARFAKSAWFLDLSEENQFVVRDALSRYVDDDDILVVVKFSTSPAYSRMFTAGAEWVTRHYGT